MPSCSTVSQHCLLSKSSFLLTPFSSITMGIKALHTNECISTTAIDYINARQKRNKIPSFSGLCKTFTGLYQTTTNLTTSERTHKKETVTIHAPWKQPNTQRKRERECAREYWFHRRSEIPRGHRTRYSELQITFISQHNSTAKTFFYTMLFTHYSMETTHMVFLHNSITHAHKKVIKL